MVIPAGHLDLSAGSGLSGLLILKLGKALNMNERVDWAAMSDEEFMALVRQLVDTPIGTDSEEE